MRGSTYTLTWVIGPQVNEQVCVEFKNFSDLIIYVDSTYPYHTSYGVEVHERPNKRQFMPLPHRNITTS